MNSERSGWFLGGEPSCEPGVPNLKLSLAQMMPPAASSNAATPHKVKLMLLRESCASSDLSYRCYRIHNFCMLLY